jgi:hypothetical protein
VALGDYISKLDSSGMELFPHAAGSGTSNLFCAHGRLVREFAAGFRNEPASPQEEFNSYGDAFDIHFRSAERVPGGRSGRSLLIRGAGLRARRHDDADRHP